MELALKKNIDNMIRSEEVAVIGYFEKPDSPLAESFHAVAKKLKEKVQFGHTSAKAILEEEKLKYENWI